MSRLPFGLHRGGQGAMDTLLTRFCQEFVGSVWPMLELLQGAAEAVGTSGLNGESATLHDQLPGIACSCARVAVR
ncbi:MAG: hypothetical protein QGG14_05420 [Planctomycetota bacterium]|nr:hypothetical protein [Planctomycetota bacterium]